MNEPTYSARMEAVRYTAEINGRPVNINVPQGLIEDQLLTSAFGEDALVDFVRRNVGLINVEVSNYLRQAPKVAGMRVGAHQLRNCK